MLKVGDRVWPRGAQPIPPIAETMTVTRIIPIEQIAKRDRHHGALIFVDDHESPRTESELALVSCGHEECESHQEMMLLCLADRPCRPHLGILPAHECPFASEILGDRGSCNCCDDCSWECAKDI